MLPHIMAFAEGDSSGVTRMAAKGQHLAGVSVLGIDDPWIWGVYLLCIFSALLCIIYGAFNWNRGGEQEVADIKEEAAWEAKEEEMQEKELGL